MKITLWQKEDFSSENDRIKHSEILSLLDKIKEKWNMGYQLISNFDEKDVYRSVFLRNRTMLKKRTGRGVNTLRSNKRKSIFLNGAIAVYDDSNEIVSYALPWEKENLLRSILSQGPSYVNEIVEKNLSEAAKDLPEDQLIVDFIKVAHKYGYFGEIKREHPLVRPIKSDSQMSDYVNDFIKSFTYISAKYIDMLHVAKRWFL